MRLKKITIYNNKDDIAIKFDISLNSDIEHMTLSHSDLILTVKYKRTKEYWAFNLKNYYNWIYQIRD